MKKGLLLTSVLSIAMLASITAGATYALFMVEEEANIAITAGEIAVSAVVDQASLKTYSLGELQVEGFANGGTATFDADSNLMLNLLTPGDSAEFTVKVTNLSNVKIKYRLSVLLEGELGEALETKAIVNGQLHNLDGTGTGWINADMGEDIPDVPVSVSLPLDAGNEWQGKSARLSVKVEVLQANGHYDNDYVSTTEALEDALRKDVEAVLLKDLVIEDESLLVGARLDLNGHRLLNTNGEVISHYSVDEDLTLKRLTYPVSVSGSAALNLDGASIHASEEGVHALHLVDFEGRVNLSGENLLKGNKNGSGIYVGSTSKLDLSGTGSLVAVGNNGADYVAGAASEYYSSISDATYANTGASAIHALGDVNIHDLASLTVSGYGVNAFGVGGDVANLTIKNTVVESARGGFVNNSQDSAHYFDGKYNKSEPQGGAAIGSSHMNANIVLENVHVKEALGGSKAAGIGATFHTAVNISVKDSRVDHVQGGASSAGIGGSRIGNSNQTAENISILIENSAVTAYGGYFGAGIGSGYDTYCHTPENSPVTTINILGTSTINATGGKYAAGIGTGFHAGGLSGLIEASVTVVAHSGEKVYKSTYTAAQDVGFGVLDPSRDGLNNTSSLDFAGTVIVVPGI